MASKKDIFQNSAKNEKFINSLPEDMKTPPKKDLFADLISNISTKEIPTNSFIRMWTLGSMQAKIAVGYFAYILKSNFVNNTEKQRLLNEVNLNTALKLLATMGYLRGIITKLGQILGSLQHIMPSEISEIMSTLQFEAPPMHYSLIREVFLDELGKEPEEVFGFFDKKAFAAASIGQVHRACLKTGEEVAVKIQYPNIAKTIQSDLSALYTLLQPIRLKFEQKYILEHIKDAEKMFMLEADYLREADFMRKARNIFPDQDKIIVPRVFYKYTTGRVLTMDYIPGCHLKKFLSTSPSQKLRDHFGELISTAILRMSYQLRTIHTDLNPGNFIFMDDGRLGMIDFGSQRVYKESEWESHLIMEKATMKKDIKTMDELTAKFCLFDNVQEAGRERLDFIRQLTLWQLYPVEENKVFDFGDQTFYKRGIELYTKAIKKQYSRYDSLYNWWNRIIIGHRTLLYSLKSRINYRNIYEIESAKARS